MMLDIQEATKIAEVKGKVQPVLLGEVPQLKLVVTRLQLNYFSTIFIAKRA